MLPHREGSALHPLVTAGLDSVALRMPRGFGAALIARFGRPLAAPSANRSGRISTTTAQAVADELGDRIALVVDGGATAVGVESTIVKVDGEGLHLLRPGGIPVEELEAIAGMPVIRSAGGAIEAPGMMASHYAPNAALRLNAAEVRAGEALLAFGPWRAASVGQAVAFRNLSETGDLREAASNLFSHLHALDRSGRQTIAVEPVPAYPASARRSTTGSRAPPRRVTRRRDGWQMSETEPTLSDDLLDRFAEIVGAAHALRAGRDIEPYVREHRGLYPGRSPLVLRPAASSEVSRILRLATRRARPSCRRAAIRGWLAAACPTGPGARSCFRSGG